MTTATVSEIKKELRTLPAEELLELCLRVVKYKKENKELMTYLLFEAHDENAYILGICREIDEHFLQINKSSIYQSKKTVRKALRLTNKFIKYSGQKSTEAELLIYFCRKLLASPLPVQSSSTLSNILSRQLVRIQKAILTLHEDLQYDLTQKLADLEL